MELQSWSNVFEQINYLLDFFCELQNIPVSENFQYNRLDFMQVMGLDKLIKLTNGLDEMAKANYHLE